MIKFYKIFILGFVLCISSLVNLWGDLSTGLIARYPFDGNASDISGNGNHGTVYGVITVADRFGQENQAYFFDGVDDYIDLGNSTSLNPANLITVSAWDSCSSLKYAPIVERYEPHSGFKKLSL